MKRQSEIQREKKKSRQEEREEEKLRKASYYRKVTGGYLGRMAPTMSPMRMSRTAH